MHIVHGMIEYELVLAITHTYLNITAKPRSNRMM